MKRRQAAVAKNTFRRMGFFERGHVPNRLRLWPVRSVTVEEDAVTLRTGRETVRWPWPTVAATIEEEPSYKAYGKTSGSHYIRRTLLLTSGSRTFRIDVSKRFPDLESTPQFLERLSRHLTVSVVKKPKRKWWQL